MENFLNIAVTNYEIMKEIQKVFRIQNFIMPLLTSGIVAFTSVLTSLISSKYAYKNVLIQLKSQRQAAIDEYVYKEKLQNHDFINRLTLEKLTELSSKLPVYYREQLYNQTSGIYGYYNDKEHYGISDKRTKTSKETYLRVVREFGNKLDTNSVKVKQLLAYDSDENRRSFDVLSRKVSALTTFGLDKYIRDIARGEAGTLNFSEVKKELDEILAPMDTLFFEITSSLDNHVVDLIDNMKN